MAGVQAPIDGSYPADFNPFDPKYVNYYNSGTGGTPGAYSSAISAGYQWDPVQKQFTRTPQSAGSNVGTFANTALNGILGTGGSLSGVGSTINGLGGGGLSPLQSAAGVGGAGTAGVTSTATGGPVSGGSGIPGIGPIDNSAANSAAYGAAKDQVGQSSRASLDSLKGELAANGLSGSGQESQGVQNVIENAAGNLGQVSRDQATTASGQALDIAKTNQSSAITQRGQDIAAQEANASLAQQQAALRASSSLDMLKLALGLIPNISVSGGTNGGGGSARVGLY